MAVLLRWLLWAVDLVALCVNVSFPRPPRVLQKSSSSTHEDFSVFFAAAFSDLNWGIM